MANRRIYFANQQVAFKPVGASSWNVAHGVQSVAVTTTFNLEQAFELGQLAIYENIEGVPDVEVTMLARISENDSAGGVHVTIRYLPADGVTSAGAEAVYGVSNARVNS